VQVHNLRYKQHHVVVEPANENIVTFLVAFAKQPAWSAVQPVMHGQGGA